MWWMLPSGQTTRNSTSRQLGECSYPAEISRAMRPAAIAESGSTVDEAFLRFKQAHTYVLLDMVQESKNFDEFRSEAERFFNEADVDEQAWESALKAVRDQHIAPPEVFAKLPRQSPDTRPARIEVERLDGMIKPFTASDNVTIAYSVADKQAA